MVWRALLKEGLGYRLFLSAVAAVVAGVLTWRLRAASFEWFEAITHFSAAEAASDSVRELTNLSGRENIWKAAVKVMFSSPLAFFFGVTPVGVTEALQNIGGLHFQAAHAHNEILQVGTGLGVPIMLAYIVFHVKVLLNGLKMLLNFKADNYLPCMLIVMVTASLFVINLAEAYLVSYFSMMSCIFFLFAGIITAQAPAGSLLRHFKKEAEEKP